MHLLYKKGDPGIPSQILDRNGDVVLGLCRICGAAEAELETSGCIDEVLTNLEDHFGGQYIKDTVVMVNRMRRIIQQHYPEEHL